DRGEWLRGKIDWYFPREAGTPKDRSTFMAGLLYHESTHYLNARHFGRVLPKFLDEGLATFFASRLHQEYYQAYRAPDRELLESNARNGLAAIAKYPDFLNLLEAPRGLGKGDAMLDRWYGLCYAMVDFVEGGAIDSRKSSVASLMAFLEKKENHEKPAKAG